MKPQAAELNLLVEWQHPDRTRYTCAGIGSLAVHLALFLALLWVAQFGGGPSLDSGVPAFQVDLSKAMPLVAPPRLLTQRAPNRAKVSKEVTLESLLSAPTPATKPGRPVFRPPAPAARPRPSAPSFAEPPKIEAALKTSTLALGAASSLPPPKLPPVEKPKLAFETPGALDGPAKAGSLARIAPPRTAVDEVVRGVARGSGEGGIVVGDTDDASLSDSLRRGPSGARSGSSLELLSDPKGVDFKPYLIQVLAAVRRNWFAVIPQSALLGRRGRVQIQFAIARNGSVPKLVISAPSGADSLDRAAVASVSASNPFPPLPGEYRSAEVRLQLSFLYNVK